VKECQECKDYRKCVFGAGKAWFSYGEIRFCPYQVLFILEHSEILRDGNWPSNPDGSIYTDPNIRTGFRDEAYYCKPEEILGEVESRLKTTGSAGEALVDEVRQGLNIDQLSRPAYKALMYVKGWRRKRTNFAQWQASAGYYKSITIAQK